MIYIYIYIYVCVCDICTYRSYSPLHVRSAINCCAGPGRPGRPGRSLSRGTETSEAGLLLLVGDDDEYVVISSN